MAMQNDPTEAEEKQKQVDEKDKIIVPEQKLKEDPRVIDLIQNVDDRGYLYEIIHGSDEYLDKFGQVYVVGDPVRNTIRAFHAHEELWDYFHIVKGSAKFILFPKEAMDLATREQTDGTLEAIAKGKLNYPGGKEVDSLSFMKGQTFILTDRKPQCLIVPAGWYHGWKSLEDDTIMISTANREYNQEKPDETRISPFVLGKEVWEMTKK